MKRKYVEESSDSSDTCEPKKRKKNQLGTKRKIVKKKRKSKKKKKSRKAIERLPRPEKDIIYTALIRLDNNDSRISVLFSLTSSCAASFAAFKDKVLEACGLASRKHV